MTHGSVAPGFEAVRRAFDHNFARHGEIGAACAAYLRGRKVVDLWGGHRDRSQREPWEEDTMVLVYSTSKGLAAMAIALAHSRGLLDYDERVAAYWPQFAQHGKGELTVRQLLAHQAGLPAIDEPLDAKLLADPDAVADVLARQTPAWTPGTRHGYHALSIGWYESELIRRVDPSGRTLGRYFAEEIATPLGLSFHFGLPAEVPNEAVASIVGASLAATLLHSRTMPPRMMLAFLRRGSLTARTFSNPKLRSTADLDTPPFRAVEIPAGGGIGQVRSIARAYAAFAAGGRELGIDAATIEELRRPATPPSRGAHDLVLRVDTAYSLGFVKPSEGFRFGSGERSFGHPGAGGSFGFADPDAEIGYAYAMNRMGFHLNDDPRDKALREALYASVARLEA
ncbi:MAG: serine hydrolase domain-containing protein [Thermoleophilaceae bacterium]